MRWLFIALIVLQDSDNVVRGYNAYKLHRRANLTLEEVEKGLKILESPDKRYGDQPYEGRRILAVEDGWELVNGAVYQEEMRKIYRRSYNARKQKQYRGEKKKATIRPIHV